MKTPTHGILGYGLARAFGWDGAKRRCVIIGAAVPDASLILAASGTAIQTVLEYGSFDFTRFKARMDQIYFSDPFLIVGHNFFHSPLNLALLAALAWIFLNARKRPPVLAFLAGAASHSAIDLFSHVDDGPLLFWPLDWETRFAGPLSHWAAGRGGLLISLAEFGVSLAALFVASARLRSRRAAREPH